MTKLKLGAGGTYLPDFVNIDISEKAEISLDLSKDPLPFETSTVDLVFSYHTIEHVPNYLFVLSEIYRVLKPGGIFLLGVPYISLTKYNLVNPYHLHHFNEYSFDFFDPEKLKGSAVEENRIRFKKSFHRFHYIGIFNLLPYPINRWCRDHLFNVVRKIDFGLYAVKDGNSTPMVTSKKEFIKLFDQTYNARIPYNKEKLTNDDSAIKAFLKKIKRWWTGN